MLHSPNTYNDYAHDVNVAASNFSSSSSILPHAIDSFISSVDHNFSYSDSRILDTRAADHMVHSVDLFSFITSIVNRFVKFPNGQFVFVTHIGIICLSEHLILSDVLCVHYFTFKLIFC